MAWPDLIASGVMPRPLAGFVNACVRGRMNILIGGGPGSGKTTTFGLVSSLVPPDEQVIAIGPSNVSAHDLVRNALRMRPDRIVVDELRDAAALDLLRAMDAGHDGMICTVRGLGPRDALDRVEVLARMADPGVPALSVREQVGYSIDLVVHQARFRDGSRRITQVTEVLGLRGDTIALRDIFVYDHQAGALRPTGLRPRCLDQIHAHNIRLDPHIFTPIRR